ncbi:MAG TPA: YlmH/Sll1252 family protein [Oscillospiraceae bacterium]|nr:YlmH/Sll1252 family protein [Oscillospiraceae bacterium]
MSKPLSQTNDSLLEAKLQDAVQLCISHNRAHFIGFLDEREAEFAKKIMLKSAFKNYMLWGGHDASERVVFGAFPDYMVPDDTAFPIVPITATFRNSDTLSHRDFLGALMSAGVNRDTLGDLLVEEGRCVLFVKAEVVEFILLQTTKIGRVGVKLVKGMQEPLPQGRNFAPFTAVVASSRLDCIVAAAVSTSREKASAMITAGTVMLNHVETTSVSAVVHDGDKLSVRGKGRFVLDQIGPVTKKGRLSIAGRKYI